jgi:uncharacterized SAM-binding protein YcdF (DUF218 family)
MPQRNLNRDTAQERSLGGLRVPQRVVKLQKRLPARKSPKKRIKLRQLVFAICLGGTLAYFQFKPAPHSPQAILVLGGEPQREQFAAEFAKQHPGLPLWVSGGSNPEYAEWVFQQAGVAENLVHLDYDAVDTVTNFTTLVDKLRSQKIDSIYLITSDYHMRRAQVIGQVILGSRGIQFEPVAIPTDQPTEPIEKAVFDGLRSTWWVMTGNTGQSWKQEFH